jgi:hypothetical protein
LTDYIDGIHWATGEFANGDVASVSMFSAAAGSPTIPGGTRSVFRVDTNIPREGNSGLPNAWEFYVYSLGLSCTRSTRPTSGSAIADLTTYSNRTDDPTMFEINRKIYWEYKYNRKSFAEGVFEDFPSGSGAFWQGTANAREVANNGAPSPRDRVAMVLPIWEREGNGYSMTGFPEQALVISQAALDASTALTFVDIRAKKAGLIKRPVS